MPQWHFDKKNTVYAWFTYHANGKYENTLIATAKSPGTQPQTISFIESVGNAVAPTFFWI